MKNCFGRKESAAFILILVTGIFAGMFYLFCRGISESRIVINEVCSNNFSLAKDENGNYSDYIELYNRSFREISLEGYYLSDDESNLQKYALDPVVVLPGEYYVVWLDGKDQVSTGKVSFKISDLGERIFMTGPDDYDMMEVPALSYNTVYGRIKDGKKETGKMTGTVGESNERAKLLLSEELSDPIFSVESGFYADAFELEIKASDDVEVYYTLDGSEPTLDSLLYQAPVHIEDISGERNRYASIEGLSPTQDYVPLFPVDKAAVVRAIGYSPRSNTVSRIITKVYFVGYEKRVDYNGFPVVSIVSNPEGLFSDETGIYVNGDAFEQYKAEGGYVDGELLETFTDSEGEIHFLYMASNAFKEGKEWEREASMTYFDASHQYCFTQNVGIRIAGQSTRATPKKSLNIYGRRIYDDHAILQYEFFPGMHYSSIKLRNGGNNNNGAVITDAFLEGLAGGRDVSIQAAIPCILFLNGEYWGIYHIRERYKEEYLSNHFGVSESNIFLIDGGISQSENEMAQEAYQYMNDVISECDLSYDDVYQMICEMIDVQSLIDYCCINLYIGNSDVSFGQNTALWRTAEPEDSVYGDCRWRWMIYDQDISAESDADCSSTWLENSVLLNEPIVQSLLKNENFRQQFCITFMDIANENYAYDTVHEKWMEQKEYYKEQIIKSHRRFFDADFSDEEFQTYFAELDDFFEQRFEIAMAGLTEAFGLTGSLEEIIVGSNMEEGGLVSINTISLDHCTEWSGQYFTDFPVTLTATANKGYRFIGWAGDVVEEDEQICVKIPQGGLSVEAIFEKVE